MIEYSYVQLLLHFVLLTITTDFTFVRYIGHPRMEVNEPLLDAWAQHMAEWLKQGITVY